MRKVIQWTLVPAVLIAAACGKGKAPSSTAMTEDLKRDLKLASATQNIQISPDEISPRSKQELALRPKKAPEGPKVMRTDHSNVKAPAAAQVAEMKTDIPQVQVMASAAAPSETPTSDAPPLARPSAVPAASYPGATPIPASGSGGILGGIFGAVIRGGAVGDDDHCDPRGLPPRRGGGRSIGGDNLPIFGGGIGGMGGTRMPVAPMGRRR